MSSKTSKKWKVKILWKGVDDKPPCDSLFPPPYTEDDCETKQRTYDFRSKQERDAFLKGVEQAIGWNEYEIVKEAEYDEGR